MSNFSLWRVCAPWGLLVCASGSVFSQTASPPDEPRLPPTLVSATRFPQAADGLPFAVTVLERVDIQRSGVRTVNEAVTALAGVPPRIDTSGGRNATLDLRGFGESANSNQVVILDGVRLSEGDLSTPRLSGIPIDSVQRIEIIRGSAAVLYGEGATGGAIVVTTVSNQPRTLGAAASVALTTGSDDLRGLSLGASFVGQAGSGELSVHAQGAEQRADNHRDNFATTERSRAATLQWRADGVTLGVRAATDRVDSGLPGSLTAAEYAANPQQTTRPNDFADVRSATEAVYARWSAGAWAFSADAGWRHKEYRADNFGPFRYDVEASNWSLGGVNTADIGWAVNRLQLGTERQRWARDVLQGFIPDASVRSTSFFLRNELLLANGTRWSAGWRTQRLNKQTVDAGVVTPLGDRQQALELGINQPLSESWGTYARVGRSFRLANADEFSFTNPARALVAQTSRDAEWGFRWTQGQSSAELRAYVSRLDNEIGYDPTAPGPFGAGANINFDPTQRRGLELEASHALASALKLSGQLALRRAGFRSGPNVGKDVPLTPRASLALRADWQAAEAHRFHGGLRWVDSQFPDFANQCRMPSYATVQAGYAFNWRQLELSLAIDNLTDRRYYTLAFACAGGVPTSLYPEAGRQVRLQARLAF